ncbi:MAG TPA: hypothetical protein PK867_28075, partial [Pirellulales bacterium]|nr:hypothetical protein [Pirellulales bacterium]
QLQWLTGTVSIEPECEASTTGAVHHSSLCFYISESSQKVIDMTNPPPEITESLMRFKTDHPDPLKAAFIMMRFGETAAHKNIVAGIGTVLGRHGITGLRADDKQYHDDLFANVATYLFGCGFGIAVFERLENDEFNPNVSLEVGYMFAMKKPVCLLKDKTLKTLHTDLVGKLYKTFDPQNPTGTIPSVVESWLFDKELAKRPVTLPSITSHQRARRRRISGDLIAAMAPKAVVPIGPGASCSQCAATLVGKQEGEDWFTCTECRRSFCRSCAPGSSNVCPKCSK